MNFDSTIYIHVYVLKSKWIVYEVKKKKRLKQYT